MKLRNKIGYGFGDVASGALWSMCTSFILIYLTDSVGIGAAIMGTMFLVTRICDGFTDVLMGALIDRTHSKWGKARPWYIASIVPLIISSILIFHVPARLSYTGKLIYVFVTYFVMTAIVYTVNSVAYNCLPAFAADNAKDRIHMNVFRFIGSTVMGIVIASVVLPLVTHFGGSITSQTGWTKVILIVSAMSLVAFAITAVSVKEIVPEKKAKSDKEDKVDQEKPVENSQKVPFVKILWYVLSNRYFIIMALSGLVGIIRTGMLAASTYYAQYNLGNGSLLGLITLAAMVPLLIGVVISPPFHIKWGMQKTMIVSRVIGMAGALVSAVFAGNFVLELVGIGLNFFMIGVSASSSAAMLAYIADYGEWKHGVNHTGTIFSCISFTTKVGTGIGTAMVGWGLALGGYVGGALVQTQSALFAIKAMHLYLPVVLTAVLLILVMFLDVEKKMPKIKEELAARNPDTWKENKLMNHAPCADAVTTN